MFGWRWRRRHLRSGGEGGGSYHFPNKQQQFREENPLCRRFIIVITMTILLVGVMCERWLSPKLINFLEFNCSHYGSANCWEGWFGQQMTNGHLCSNGNNSNWTTNSVPANNCPHLIVIWWGGRCIEGCIDEVTAWVFTVQETTSQPGQEAKLFFWKKTPLFIGFLNKIYSFQSAFIDMSNHCYHSQICGWVPKSSDGSVRTCPLELLSCLRSRPKSSRQIWK